MEEMEAEYEAWQHVITQLRDKIGQDDLNGPEFELLFASITLWGERLHQLRSTQDGETVNDIVNQSASRWANATS